MAHSPLRRTALLFGATAVYIILQFVWWAYLLVQKDREMEALVEAFDLRPSYPGELPGHADRTLWMVVGEGTVFLIILLVALFLLFRGVQQEIRYARQQRNFLLAITHELRTPVAAVKLQLQTLRRKGLSDELRSELQERALDDVDRLGILTEKLLLASRMEERAFPLNLAEVDLVPLTRDLVEQAQRTFAAGHVLALEAPAQALLRTDATAYRTVLENLLENASKYAPVGSRITVRVAQEADRTVLSVADEGPGIPLAERERIFDRFHRSGDEQVRTTKGTGLGLYIVKRLMEALGGRISVREAPSHGSIFVAEFFRKVEN